MQLRVLSYGHAILQQKSSLVDEVGAELRQLIVDMWDTMYAANGCGLAAPQVGRAVNVFVVDSKSTYDALNRRSQKRYYPSNDTGVVETFINARIVTRSQRIWTEEEGCLSMPGFVRPVTRAWSVTVNYQDRELKWHSRAFAGMTARMIQHEYDHVNGVLFTDLLDERRRRELEPALRDIAAGRVHAAYPLKFPD